MASSSISSVHKSFKYDVFLSFRGEDTRKNFVDHLYSALQQKNIHTYRDEERIKKGKMVTDELIRSIEDSRFYIIVFSKNYASSSWCLDELIKIMECQKMTHHAAYPVFYDVEPTEIRKQSGAVKEAFAIHEKEEASGKWREAMKKAADLAGWELKTTADGHEAKFIQKIVEELSLELRSINFSIDDKLVGMDTRVHSVVSSLGLDFDDVRMIGIKGIGGGGKTTLARAVFDQIAFQFEGKSFVENVREDSNPSLSGLKSLQKQVLSDLLNDHNIIISGVGNGRAQMKKTMSSKKVLLVLDDVDRVEQLEALAGERDWFGEGSRIIITTRDEQVLLAHRVKLIHNVNLLSDKEAIRLFNRYAFGREIQSQGYDEISRRFVRYANGLPLTIRVLGSSLCGKDKAEWEDALKRLKDIPLVETMEILELSYIRLEEDYRNMFLDVACLLKGETKHYAIKALESCGFHAKNGLRVLQQKSLITIDRDFNSDECVGMHDHIAEMGRHIVRRSHPDMPNQHSRLWINKEIEDILANGLGTDETRCIQLHEGTLDPEIVMEGLSKMKKLRFLDVDVRDAFDASVCDCFPWHWKSNKVNSYFPDALRYVRWRNYPFRSLPRTFKANNLVSLEIAYSEIGQLWEGGEEKVFNELKSLSLYDSRLMVLDLKLTPNLETLTLGGSNEQVKIHTRGGCSNLIYVVISWLKLRMLDLRSAENLKMLDLRNCYDLEELHMPDACQNLRSIHISNLKLKTIDLRQASKLQMLRVKKCDNLVELYMPDRCINLISITLTNLKLRTIDLRQASNLEMLRVENCDNLVEFYMHDRCINLISLTLSKSKLRTLDIGLTPDLEYLDLENCFNFEELHMADECQKLAYLDISHSNLKTLDLGLTPNLENLYLKDCCNLIELKAPVGCLKKLVHLNLSGCLRFSYFEFKVEADTFSRMVGPVAELKVKAESLDICLFHPDNNLPKFQFECSYEKSPPSLSRNLEKLISFGPCACTNFETFSRSVCGLQNLKSLKLEGSIPEAPKDLGQLECLEELTLLSTNIIHLPDSICMLKHLKSLKLESCWLLEKLPEDLGQLECLEILSLSSAEIKHLPDSICMLKHLKSLTLYCWFLEKLPEDLGKLECLEKLSLSSTKIKDLPDSMCVLKHLKSFKLHRCPLLEKFPEDFGRLECLEMLSIIGCESLRDLPNSISLLKGLRIIR